MKRLNQFILERLKLSKNEDKINSLYNLDFSMKNYQEVVNEIKEFAKNNDLNVSFRFANYSRNSGDFTFFIYDKKKQKRYLVGYDGNWKSKEDDFDSFKNCALDTIKYIENYKH